MSAKTPKLKTMFISITDQPKLIGPKAMSPVNCCKICSAEFKRQDLIRHCELCTSKFCKDCIEVCKQCNLLLCDNHSKNHECC